MVIFGETIGNKDEGLDAWRYSFLWQSKCIKIVLTKRWLLPSVTACYGNGNMRLNDDCSCQKNPI